MIRLSVDHHSYIYINPNKVAYIEPYGNISHIVFETGVTLNLNISTMALIGILNNEVTHEEIK